MTIKKGEEPKELLNAKKYYEQKLEEVSKFLLNCDRIRMEPHEEYYTAHDSLSFIKINHDVSKDAARFPLSFKVSGFDKRVIMLLVDDSRKSLCYSEIDYKRQTCTFIQDTSVMNYDKHQ